MSEKDYYEILGCTEEASYENIKRAYHELVLRYHPDKIKDSEQSSEKFHQIQEAWEILGHSENRKLYNAERKQAKLVEESILLFARLTSDELYPKDGETLAYQCRCGSEYLVEKNDLEIHEQVYIACDECTFYIFVETKKQTSDSAGT